jgi:hypothetical protein
MYSLQALHINMSNVFSTTKIKQTHKKKKKNTHTAQQKTKKMGKTAAIQKSGANPFAREWK